MVHEMMDEAMTVLAQTNEIVSGSSALCTVNVVKMDCSVFVRDVAELAGSFIALPRVDPSFPMVFSDGPMTLLLGRYASGYSTLADVVLDFSPIGSKAMLSTKGLRGWYYPLFTLLAQTQATSFGPTGLLSFTEDGETRFTVLPLVSDRPSTSDALALVPLEDGIDGVFMKPKSPGGLHGGTQFFVGTEDQTFIDRNAARYRRNRTICTSGVENG